MTYILLKLIRHIFLVLLICSVIFSFSFAYLTSVVVDFFLTSPQRENFLELLKVNKAIPFTLPEKKPYEDYEKLLSGNLLQLSLGSGVEENISVETKDIELLGVISGSPTIARALIRIKDEKAPSEYAIGEIVGGNKILNIFYNSILVLRGSRELEIFVGEDSTQSKEQAKTEEQATFSQNVQKVTIKRSKVIQLTQNQAQLYENKFTPITKEGKILGIKMIFIPNSNFLYELGARSGDIIRRINGQPLDNMNKMMELWQSIQTLNKVSVEIERSGKILPFEILIQD